MNEEYLKQLYDYLVSTDNSFAADVPFNDFVSGMGGQQYAAQIYSHLGSLDPSFKTDVNISDFMLSVGTVKKKDEPQKDGDSPSANTSLAASSQNKDPQFLEPLVTAQDTTINGFTVRGRDTRTDDYVNPTTALRQQLQEAIPMSSDGGWIAQSERSRAMRGDTKYQQAAAQFKADVAYTQELKEAEQPYLLQLQQEEEKRKKEEKGKIDTETQEVIGTEEFKTALEGTTPESIALEEDEAVEYFNNLYADYGFTFRKSGIGDAMIVTEKTNGENIEIDLDPFFSSTEKNEAIKLQNFITKYARKPEDVRESIEDNFIQASLRAQNLREKSRKNEDGSESTVLFESAVIDGKNVVYPTLFPKYEGSYTSDPEFWMEKSGMDAYATAKDRGEVFVFETEDEANAFAAGNWKDVNTSDAEADRYFKEKGYDYVTLKEQFDTYQSIQDKIDFIDKAPFKYNDLEPEQKVLYKDLYDPATGQIRNDINKVQQALYDQADEWSGIYTDDDLQELREDFDVYMDKKYQALGTKAIMVNNASKYVDNELKTKSLSLFGVDIDELVNTEVPENMQPQKDALLTTYKASKDVAQLAANQYEIANTFLDTKFDKNLRGEFVENWAGVSDEWIRGWNRGQVGNEILKLSLGLEDLDDDASVADIAEAVVRYMDKAETGKVSRALYRWHQARGFVEAWDAYSDNPLELMTSLAANSMSQMLPYGWKIISSTTAAGAGTGALTGLAGGPFAEVTVPAGAIIGTGWGLRTGFSATSLALEYTNEVMDAARYYGYDINDPNSIKDAFMDENVWARGRERGFARGIPIAIIDLISAGIAGRVFQVGKTSALGTRVAAFATERLVIDPLFEGAGELAAQINVGDELQYKEIFAEMMGSVGANGPMASFNMALDLKMQNNLKVANDLTTINGLLNETKGVFKPSLGRVSAWANNMERLGQITPAANQRIQENIGLMRDADNVLSANPDVKKSQKVMSRTMELMAAKEELSSTPNRKNVFKNKLKEINQELQEIAETGNVRPEAQEEGNTFEKGFQTFLGGISLNRQTSDTDIRETAKASYTIDGISYARNKFLRRINDMSDDELYKRKIVVDNDESITEVLSKKVENAISKRKTREVDADKQTGDIQTVEETVREVSEEQTTEPTTTQEGITLSGPLTTDENNNIVTETGEETGFTLIDNNDGTFDVTQENETIVSKVVGKEGALKRAADELTKTTKVEEETIEDVVIPQPIVRPTKADKTAFDNETIEQTRLDGILAGIADKQIANKKLTPFQQKVAEKNQSRIDEIVSSKTLQDEVADLEATLSAPQEVVTEEVATEEVNIDAMLTEVDAELSGKLEELNNEIAGVKADLKNSLKKKGLTKAEKADLREDAKAEINSLKEDIAEAKREAKAEKAQIKKDAKEGKVDFKTDNKFEADVDEVAEVTAAINNLESGNVLTTMDETQEDVTIDVDEINTRTDRPIPKLKSLAVIKGVPVVFSISDQLTTGQVVNPQTGNIIDNLRGGIGFTGTIDNENAAWANTTEKEANDLKEKAVKIYQDNKEFFEQWWKDNPQYNGLVPMPIVKMGEGSILSNEATFRVFRDNLSKIPEENRRKAVQVLEEDLRERIKTRQDAIDSGQKTKTTEKNYAKEIAGLKSALQAIEDAQPELIDDVVTEEFLSKLSLPARRNFLERLTFGQPNRAGTQIKINAGRKRIPKILIEGMSKDAISLVHLAPITDLITEPGLKNVKQRSIISIQGIDVLNPEVIEAVHPNYPYGVKGKSIGILENPISLVRAYPEAYKKAMAGLVADESKGRTVTAAKRQRATEEQKETMPQIGELDASSVGSILTETLGVQNGLPANEFIAAISFGDMDNVSKLTSFMNIAFPSVNISTDQQTFNTVIEQDNVVKYRKGNEVIYGVTVDGDIYINPDVHNSTSALHNTAIHEMGHVWTDYLQTTRKGRNIYAKGVALVEQTEEYQKQLKKFKGDKKKAANETMAILIGNKGQTIADASIKSKFKEWLLGMWKFIKSQFKQTKDLTEEEIQNLTLDEFIGSALADIFAGKEVKLSDKQLKNLKNPEAAFSSDLSMTEIIEIGRKNGFSDSSIKQVLKGRGFKVADINEAMTVRVDLFTELPPAFARVEGGIQEAYQMFNDIKVALNKWATDGLGNVIGLKRVKTFGEIRQKAQELIKNHPTYKKQQDQIQRELRIDLDKTLGYRGGTRAFSQEMSDIRRAIRENRIGVKNQKDYITRLKNFIRASLPESKAYTKAQIQRLINSVNRIDVRKDNLEAETERVIKIVEQQRAKEKRSTIEQIAKLAKAKAKPRLQSKKTRAKGIDALGQVIFKNVTKVLNAATIVNPEVRARKLEEIKTYLEAGTVELNGEKVLVSSIVDAAIQKSINGETLTALEENLMQLQMAYDTFGDIQNKTLEEVQELLEDIKREKTESIMRFNNERLKRAADNQVIAEQATEQIQKTNTDLFTEDGNLKDKNERNQDLEKLKKDFTAKGIITKVYNVITKNLFGRTEGMITRAKNQITNLGTITNFLDNKVKGLNVFTDQVYRKLARMHELALSNQRLMKRKVDEIAKQSGIENGFEGVEKLLNQRFGFTKLGKVKTKTLNLITSKTGRKYKSEFNANQLLRIYALSKNPVQRAKLLNQGITDKVLADIKSDLGTELITFADKMVGYLSTDYFNEINSVYRQANGVNLGFVENYFPTKTIAPKVDAKLLQEGNFNGIFSADTAPAFKERTDLGSDINLKEGTFSNTLMNHMETMERYKAYAIGVQEMNAFMNIPAVNALLEVSGLKSLTKLIINAEINPQSAAQVDGTQSTIVEYMQRKFTSFALAFKVVQIFKQAISFMNAYEKYNYFKPDSKIPKKLQGPIDFTMFMVDGAGVLFEMGKDLVGMNGAIAKARKMSATFDKRVQEGLEGDVYGLESGSQTFKQAGKGTGLYQRGKRAFKTLAARPTIIGDIMGVMGYYINYKRNIANGMSEAQALEEFNEYNPTQQSRRNMDKIPLQLKGDMFSKGFTMFGSTLFLQINKVMQSFTNISRALAEKKTPKKQDVRAFYLNAAVVNVLFVGVSNIALLTKGDDEDKEVFMRRIKDAMMGLNLLYQIPYLGAAAEKGINYLRDDKKPVDDVVNPFSAIVSKIQKQQRKDPDAWFKTYMVPLMELAMGAQVDPFIGLYNAIQDGVFGNDTSSKEYYNNVYDFLGITPSYRPDAMRNKRGVDLEGVMPIGGIKTKTDLKRYDPELYDRMYGRQDEIRKEQRERRRERLEAMGYVERNGKLYRIK